MNVLKKETSNSTIIIMMR